MFKGLKGNRRREVHHTIHVTRHMSGEEASYPLIVLGSIAGEIVSYFDYSISVNSRNRIQDMYLESTCS